MNRIARFSTPIPNHWLVVSAWRPELAYFRRHLKALERDTSFQFSLAEVGIGLVKAAIGTTNAINLFRPQGVLLIGTAGLYSPHKERFSLGSAALVRRVSLVFDLSNDQQAFLPKRMQKTCTLPHRFSSTFLHAAKIPHLDVACPVGITRHAKAAKNVAKAFCADLENLETYAALQAARVASLPFVAILGLANEVGPQGHRQWLKHGKQAAENACMAAWAGFQRMAAKVPNQ